MKMLVDDLLVDLNPELLAEYFSELDSEQQAKFYNHLAELSKDWITMQLQYITDEDGLNLAGRRVMQQIGDYSHWGLCNFSLENSLGMKKQK